MAIELIDLGTEGANNGDGLRDGGAKINDNFTELSSVNGWGYYKDSNTTTPTQTFNSTPSKLLIDGLIL